MPMRPDFATTSPAFTASPPAVYSTRISGVAELTSSTVLPAAITTSPLGLEITAPASGLVTMDTVGSAFDTILAVYTNDTLVSLTNVVSDEDSGGFLTSAVQFNAVAGTVYQIAVDGFGRPGSASPNKPVPR